MRRTRYEKATRRIIVRGLAIAGTLSLTVTLAPLHGSEQLTAAAGESDRGAPRSRWIVRGGPQWLVSTGDEAGDLTMNPALGEGERTEKTISDDLGFGLELEYLATRRVGVEATLHLGDFSAGLNLDTPAGRARDQRDIGFAALTLGVNYHLTPGRRGDLYMGAFAQRSDYDDITHRFPELGRSAELTFQDAVGWGLKAGLDVPLGPDSPWLLALSVRHFREPLDVKPVIGSLYLGYRLR